MESGLLTNIFLKYFSCYFIAFYFSCFYFIGYSASKKFCECLWMRFTASQIKNLLSETLLVVSSATESYTIHYARFQRSSLSIVYNFVLNAYREKFNSTFYCCLNNSFIRFSSFFHSYFLHFSLFY